MTRPTRVLLALASVALMVTPAAQVRSGSPRTLTIRTPVPAAGDVSIVAFEMSIGGEGKHHHRQPVDLVLRNHHEPGVFALARLRPEPYRPGRFLGLLEVFHRATATTSVLPANAHAASGLDEFLVRARNERIIKEVIKDNIEALAVQHHLGPCAFCDPLSKGEYLLGNAIIGASYLLAGPLLGLPTNTTPSQLADDAVYELCDEVEDEEEGVEVPDDESEYP